MSIAVPVRDAARRPRVLMLAYACRPHEGSEPGMGWNRAIESAREFDTWVICEGRRNAPAIRSFLEQHGQIPGLHFAFLPQSSMQRWLAKTPGMFYLAYNRWHRQALALAEQLHAEHEFDLVHQVTYCGYREPGYAWKLPVPFVWGPIGGTHNFPWRFLGQAGMTGAIGEAGRSFMNNLQFRFSSHVRTAVQRAALVLAGNSATQGHFRDAFSAELPLFPASGIANQVGFPRSFGAHTSLRLLWCGYLHPLKGLPLLLRALASLPANFSYELRIVGDGPYGTRWQRLARRLGIDQHLEWTGQIPHSQTRAQYEWADALVFTSLRDTFPTVVLESLSAGLPVICLDHLGMGDIVDSTCGLKIPLTTPREAIAGVREAITSIAGDAARWEELSRGAIDRADVYTWSHQGQQLAHLYRQLLGKEVEVDTSTRAGQPQFAGDRR